MKFLMAAVLCLLGASRPSQAATVNGQELSKTAQAVAFTQDINTEDYRDVSVQVNFISTTPPSAFLLDGQYSSATLTVSNFPALVGQASSATVTLLGNIEGALTTSYITINGKPYTQGTDWIVTPLSSTGTAASIASAMNSHFEYKASASSNVITVLARSSGTTANSWTISQSKPSEFSTTSWRFGQDFGYISINGVTLTEGSQWFARTSSAITAVDITTAINSSSGLWGTVIASNTGLGIVKIRARDVGYNNYAVSLSTPPAGQANGFTPSFSTLVGGATSHINPLDDTFAAPSHGYSTGLKMIFTTVSGATPGNAPGGLSDQTTYFAILNGANSFKVASTQLNAIGGTAIDITSVTSGGTFTFAPVVYSSNSASFNWLGSNDGSTFYDLTSASVSSVTFAGNAGTGQLFSFPVYTYKWLRLNFTGPNFGGITMTAISTKKK